MGPCEGCCPPDPNRMPSLQFTYGREGFSGPTRREHEERAHAEFAADGQVLGVDYEPVP